MPHSLIIQLTEKKVSKKEHITIFDINEDAVYLNNADYGGAEGNFKESFSEIKQKLGHLATFNKKKQTMTFRKETQLKRLYMDKVRKLYLTIKNTLRQDGMPDVPNHRRVIQRIESLGTYNCLLHYDDGSGAARCHTAAEAVIDYLNGRIPRTMKIGAILDYHYPLN